MNPIAAFGLMSLLSSGLNRIGAGSEVGRREALRKALMDIFSTGALSNDTNDIFGMMQRSPAYSGARNSALVQSSALANAMQTSFARRGLSTSGIAGMALPAARSSFGQTFANIDTDMFTKALSMARENQMTRGKILTDTWGPSTGQLTAGNTINSMMPYLFTLMQKYGLPGLGAGPGK